MEKEIKSSVHIKKDIQLVIDTSGKSLSLAVLSGQIILAEITLDQERTHAKVIETITKQVCTCANIMISEIDYISVVTGPGSYTGLRIGIAQAKAMAFARDIKIVPITTFEAILAQVDENKDVTVVSIDATHNRLYIQLFYNNRPFSKMFSVDYKEVATCFDGIFDKEIEKDKTIRVIGSGANILCALDEFNVLTSKKTVEITQVDHRLLAGKIGQFIDRQLSDQKRVAIDPEEVVANYINLSQAERMMKQKISDDTSLSS